MHDKLLKIIFIPLGAVLLIAGCDTNKQEFNPTDYFPVSEGNFWEFDNTIKTLKIREIIRENGITKADFAYLDSLDSPLWIETFQIDPEQVYWEAMIPSVSILPVVEFDPPIPMAPFSKKEWAKRELVTTEIQSTSSVTTSKLKVNYEIQEIADVIVPAGVFYDCIKMKMSFQYTTPNSQPFFLGDYYWWFAKGVGPVKYDFPVEVGNLTSCNIIKERLSTQPPTLSR